MFLSRFDRVIVALDPDALPKTLQIAGKLRSVIPDVRVLRLSDDLKYGNFIGEENYIGSFGDVDDLQKGIEFLWYSGFYQNYNKDRIKAVASLIENESIVIYETRVVE